jgi:hypothetical protein
MRRDAVIPTLLLAVLEDEVVLGTMEADTDRIGRCRGSYEGRTTEGSVR